MNSRERINRYLKNNGSNNDGIWVIGNISDDLHRFEELYLRLRKEEGRVYSTEVIQQLPNPPQTHELKEEWSIRQKNALRLKKYIQTIATQTAELVILDLGCGNGWFSNYISDIPNVFIIGVDINEYELNQARKITSSEKSQFILANILEEQLLPENCIDLVILNSTFQYFNLFSTLYDRLSIYLSDISEVHIVDTMIYSTDEQQKARQRTIDYYTEQQMPNLANYYYHHTWDEFEEFDYLVKYNPDSIVQQIKSIFTTISPFYWIIVENKLIAIK